MLNGQNAKSAMVSEDQTIILRREKDHYFLAHCQTYGHGEDSTGSLVEVIQTFKPSPQEEQAAVGAGVWSLKLPILLF